VQDATAPIAIWTAEPWALALPASEGPFLLELHDLCLAVEGDGSLGSAQATGAQYWVVFQELVIGPFPPSTRSEGGHHAGETNLCSFRLFQLT
jgi:hypothetical protein